MPLNTLTTVSGSDLGQTVRMWITPFEAPDPYIEDADDLTTSTWPTCSMGK